MTGNDGNGPRFQRGSRRQWVGQQYRRMEDSLETRAMPWIVLSAIATVAAIVSWLIWGNPAQPF